MRSAFHLLALLVLAAPLAGCGPTLTRGPVGWHDSAFPFSVAPLEDGALFAQGWTLAEYTAKDQGFRRGGDELHQADLELKRVQDDGVVVVVHYEIEDDDRAKLPEVLLERWLDRVVANPKGDEEGDEYVFRPVVPRLETTAKANVMVGWSTLSSTTVHGHALQVDSRETFAPPASSAAEVTVTIAPPGAPPDHRLYVAVVKPIAGKNYAVVVYGNTPAMFDGGLADARSLAHRLRF